MDRYITAFIIIAFMVLMGLQITKIQQHLDEVDQALQIIDDKVSHGSCSLDRGGK